MISHRTGRPTSGQLMLPMLGLLFMFGVFVARYIHWCREEYWTMRMTIAARATALSVGRTEAEMLNTLGSLQLAENIFVQKVSYHGEDIGGVQDELIPDFWEWNQLLKETYDLLPLRAWDTAQKVAHANKADRSVIPLGRLTPDLEWKPLYLVYLFGIIPDGVGETQNGYLARSWGISERKAQPEDQVFGWRVCHNGASCANAWSQLWLDVKEEDPLANGGFPRVTEDIWGGIGIQSFYPQFNARPLSRKRP